MNLHSENIQALRMVLWKLQIVLAIETVVDALDVVVLRPALHHFLRTSVFHATDFYNVFDEELLRQ